MVYKKYVKRGGKTFGPYYYESYRDSDGKVKTRYLENYKPRGISAFSKVSKKNVTGFGKYVLVFALVALLGFFAYSMIFQNYRGFTGYVVNFAGGDGSLGNPYQISDCLQLNKTRENLTANFILMNDIDCSDTRNWNYNSTLGIYEGWQPIGNGGNGYMDGDFHPFVGNFNGGGYRVTDLYLNRDSLTGFYYISAGLFGLVWGPAIIEDVHLSNVNITATGYTSVGSLVGFVGVGAKIDGCSASGRVDSIARSPGRGNYYYYGSGGLVGFLNAGNINNSYSLVDVFTSIHGGGLVSFAASDLFPSTPFSIMNSYSAGRIYGQNFLGRLVGKTECGSSQNCEIRNSFALGRVEHIGAPSFSFNYTGGLVGLSVPAIVGGLYVNNLVPSNSFWNNHTVMPRNCYNKDTTEGVEPYLPSNEGCDVVQNDIEYFYDTNSNPISSFDSSVWDLSICDDVGFPPLINEGITDSADCIRICPDGMIGNGSIENPCQVEECGQLQSMNQEMQFNMSYTLVKDIDCSDTVNWNGGKGFEPIGCPNSLCGSRVSQSEFFGNFYGRNHTISDLYISRPDEGYTGLFGRILGDISDVRLEDAYVEGDGVVGGLAGNQEDGIISNSYSASTVIGVSDVGGLVGYSLDSETRSSYSTGSVTGSDPFLSAYLGGLVGYQLGGIVNNSYSRANVSGYASVGGLVGYITDAGLSNPGAILNSYSTGSVSGDGSGIGGLLGVDGGAGGIVSNSYWDNQTSGQSISYGGTGKTTAQMKNVATYSSWDFTNIWREIPNDYPKLRWENYTSVVLPNCAASMRGNGTLSDPCQITTCTQLQAMRDNLTANYILMNNIDCSGFDYGDGKGFKPVGSGEINSCGSTSYSPFIGSIDGRGYNITNLFIFRPSQACVGMLSVLMENGSINNLGLVNVSVTGSTFTGGLYGTNHREFPLTPSYTVINGSFVSGSIIGGQYTGGLVGFASNLAILNSFSTGSVSAVGGIASIVGGLVGEMDGVSINSSYSVANVSGSSSCGGLVGDFIGMISDSYARGNITCGRFGLGAVGGLIAVHSGGTISNSYSTGNIFADNSGVGGLIGWDFSPYGLTFINCFSTSNISNSAGGNVGALVGSHAESYINNSYYWNYTGSPTNCSNPLTYPNYPTNCTAVNDKTLFYSSSNEPLKKWNFTHIWMEVLGDYPILRMGNVSTTPVCVPDNSCAASTCSGSSCTNNCGQSVSGTKSCPCTSNCGGGGGGGGGGCTDTAEDPCVPVTECDANNKMTVRCVSSPKGCSSRLDIVDCGCISGVVCAPWSGDCKEGGRVRICEESCTKSSMIQVDNCAEEFNRTIDYTVEYPEANCGNWSLCEVNYNFVDLLSGIENLKGRQRRVCVDGESGVEFYQITPCSTKLNVTARRLEWCGENYVEIIDKATNKTVSLINDNIKSVVPSLDISLLDSKPKYCAYCYNGVKDKDEEETDCGGSCRPCSIEESYLMNWLQKMMWVLKF